MAPNGLHGCDNFTQELIKKREVGGVNKSSAAAEKDKERQRESKYSLLVNNLGFLLDAKMLKSC